MSIQTYSKLPNIFAWRKRKESGFVSKIILKCLHFNPRNKPFRLWMTPSFSLPRPLTCSFLPGGYTDPTLWSNLSVAVHAGTQDSLKVLLQKLLNPVFSCFYLAWQGARSCHRHCWGQYLKKLRKGVPVSLKEKCAIHPWKTFQGWIAPSLSMDAVPFYRKYWNTHCGRGQTWKLYQQVNASRRRSPSSFLIDCNN